MESTIDICELKNRNPWFDIDAKSQTFKFLAYDLEVILPTQVREENFMDMLNLLRANYGFDGSDWKKALVSKLIRISKWLTPALI